MSEPEREGGSACPLLDGPVGAPAELPSDLPSPPALPRPRAGADEVIAVEQSQHMCDVGEEATIANGFLGKIMMLDK